jgi:hypothetical protein
MASSLLPVSRCWNRWIHPSSSSPAIRICSPGSHSQYMVGKGISLPKMVIMRMRRMMMMIVMMMMRMMIVMMMRMLRMMMML